MSRTILIDVFLIAGQSIPLAISFFALFVEIADTVQAVSRKQDRYRRRDIYARGLQGESRHDALRQFMEVLQEKGAPDGIEV